MTPLRLARLGNALRAHGVRVTLRDEVDAAEALSLVEGTDRQEVKDSLGIALKISHADFEIFDQLFAIFWEGETAAPSPRKRLTPAAQLGTTLSWNPQTRQAGGRPDTPPAGQRPGFSSEALLRHKPFIEDWSTGDLVQMERLLARLAQQLANRKSRRLIPSKGRGKIDIRSSYLRALRTSGELVSLAHRQRAIEAPRVVFLVDTSGSMDKHTRFLLTFTLALRRAVRHAEVFAFNTELVRLTPALASRRTGKVLDRVAASVPDWSGGTRIGECLTEFFTKHFVHFPYGKTTVVVISDGLDRGDATLLAQAVRQIQRHARRLIWLNPLAGDRRYQPEAAGMQAALPFVDYFGSAHDFSSLQRLVPQLVI